MAYDVEQFKQAAVANAWAAAEQIEILLAVIADCGVADQLGQFVDRVVRATQPTAPPAPAASQRVGVDSPNLQRRLLTAPAVENPPDTRELEAFFDWSLARSRLANLLELPVREKLEPGGTVVEAVLPEAQYRLATQLLSGAAPPAADKYAAGDFIAGYKVPLADGDWVAWEFYAGGVSGAYLDAHIVLSAAAVDQHPQWAPPSLPARTTLAEDFDFVYPDARHRVIRLISE